MSPRLAVASVICLALAGYSGTTKTTVAAAAAQQGRSTLDDQVDLALTVYNSDIALVRDVRELQLTRGTFDLRFMDVAATVNFRSLTEPTRVSVLEQNYEYDLLEPDKLLRKYVGRDVTLVRSRQVDGSTREEEVTARLLSYNNQPVWQMMLWQLLWWIGQSFFPLLMWLILRQPEVANQFARVQGGGFEVVPFAQTARDHITPPRP